MLIRLTGANWESDGESQATWLTLEIEGRASLYELELRVQLREGLVEDDVTVLYVEELALDKRIRRALEREAERWVQEHQDECCAAVVGAWGKRGTWRPKAA